MRRGDIWWAALPRPTGSGPGFRRPLLIVQSDDFNRSRIRTVIAAVITSNLHLGAAPGNVPLPAKISGLPRSSVINVSQLVTVDKSFLLDKATQLPPDVMRTVEEGIRLVLAL